MPQPRAPWAARCRNCPFHIAIYKQGFYSYRDLPLRWCELGTVYRYERSGTMHGAPAAGRRLPESAAPSCRPRPAGEFTNVLVALGSQRLVHGVLKCHCACLARPCVTQ
jgi:hypothetical protein